MDRKRLYEVIDIEDPSEFKYYENLASLLEAEEMIEEDLIEELVKDLDMTMLAELFDSYFAEFSRHVPEEENDLLLASETAKDQLLSALHEEMTPEDYHRLAEALYRFRKWYVLDKRVRNELTGEDVSVRDARYDMAASKLIGSETSYDFTDAGYAEDGYDILVSDLFARAEDSAEEV